MQALPEEEEKGKVSLWPEIKNRNKRGRNKKSDTDTPIDRGLSENGVILEKLG